MIKKSEKYKEKNKFDHMNNRGYRKRLTQRITKKQKGLK